MKVLVICAHPNPESFNHALLEEFTKGLKEAGYGYESLDLFASGFDPCFKPGDFSQFTGGQMPDDVQEQQKKVKGAEALVFIHPVWWWGPPAILKGWLDRVFSFGFAYKLGEKGPEGLLDIKKVLLITTTMGGEAQYKALGIEDAMKTIDRATFTGVCGIKDVEHIFMYEAATDAEARKGHLELANRLGKEF